MKYHQSSKTSSETEPSPSSETIDSTLDSRDWGHSSDLSQLENPGLDFSHEQTPRQVEILSEDSPTIASVELPEIVRWHLEKQPFAPPANACERSLWFEGSFNPVNPAHIERVRQQLQDFGFKTVIMGIVPQNIYKDSSQIVDLQLRKEMIAVSLKHEGLPIAKSPNEAGVYITNSPADFHIQRYRTWANSERYLLVGPDNFQNYYENNLPWDQFFGGMPVVKHLAQSLTRFQNLYDSLLGDRILVPDHEFAVHSTDIRTGEAAHPSLETYFQERGLFGREKSIAADKTA